MKKPYAIVCALWFVAGTVLAQEAVSFRSFEPMPRSVDTGNIRLSRGGSRELRSVYAEYVQDLAALIDDYYVNVKVLGFEPLSLTAFAETEELESVLVVLIERCGVADELIELGVEAYYDLLDQLHRDLREMEGVNLSAHEEVEEAGLWALTLFEYERLVVLEKKQLFEALYNSIGLWDVEDDAVVFVDSADAAGFAGRVKEHLRNLKKLESIEQKWDLRSKMQPMPLHQFESCWIAMESVVNGY